MATTKQKRAAEILVGSGGDMTVTKAMREAGYSEATINTPQKLTESKAFALILEEAGVTDIKLSEVLRDGLGATRVVVMGKESNESFVDVQPDFAIRHKYLETGLKMKGLAPKESSDVYNFTQINAELKQKYDD